MTLTQITFFFLGILCVIGIAMLVHSWIDKRRIKRNFLRLTADLSGKIIQENPLIYPRFSGEIGGRQFDLFFKVVKAGRQHILYYVYSVQSELSSDLLLLKADYFKPITDEAGFTETAGGVFPSLEGRYQARSQNPEKARRFLEEDEVRGHLTALDEFSSLQLGPDALVVGKPYDGPPDTEPAHILKNVYALEKLAAAMERCPAAA
jgi:hypothetical protein